MQVTLKSKNRKLTPAEDEAIRRKLDRLPRYLEQISEAEVIVGSEHPHRGADQEVVQLTVRANGTLLRAEEKDPDWSAAFDLALDKIERRIQRYKGRFDRKKRRQRLSEAMAADLDTEMEDEADEAEARPVVRTKRFAVVPMTLEDAVEQMELLGHTFFLFRDSESKQLGVLYRRTDGTYGVLEPD
jgi:putative sigma-54 modulation protein